MLNTVELHCVAVLLCIVLHSSILTQNTSLKKVPNVLQIF